MSIVKDALELIDSEQRDVVRAVLARIGTEDKITVEDICNYFPTITKEEEGLALLYLIGALNRNRFAAKLSFEQRCEILALSRIGYSRELLAKVYKIERRTVTHIYNPLSLHYKAVREMELKMGRANFIKEYITPNVIGPVLAFMGEKKTNNKHANGKMGLHVVQGPNCKYAHRVTIKWLELGEDDVSQEGWYYRDLDSDLPDTWFMAGGPESLKNSKACYDAMLEDIIDRVE